VVNSRGGGDPKGDDLRAAVKVLNATSVERSLRLAAGCEARLCLAVRQKESWAPSLVWPPAEDIGQARTRGEAPWFLYCDGEAEPRLTSGGKPQRRPPASRASHPAQAATNVRRQAAPNIRRSRNDIRRQVAPYIRSASRNDVRRQAVPHIRRKSRLTCGARLSPLADCGGYGADLWSVTLAK
jgi:hypothetical protein